MTKILGRSVEAESTAALDVGGTKLQGARYKLPLQIGQINGELLFDAYEIPGDFGAVRYFLLLGDWDGENLQEESLVRELLRTSFEATEGHLE